jgi:hypothetical protein
VRFVRSNWARPEGRNDGAAPFLDDVHDPGHVEPLDPLIRGKLQQGFLDL